MQSQFITVIIEQPFDEVYGFLADPMNFPSWGPVTSLEIHHLHGSDWLIQMPRGPLVIRFTEPNLYGVLDYTMAAAGLPPEETVPVRLVRNGPHAELVVMWRQGPTVSDAQFAGQVAGINDYLGRLKRMLEADPT